MSIKVTIASTGVGVCALTQKEGDGLTVSFDNDTPSFLSWKSFKQLLSMKATQVTPDAKRPATMPSNPPTAQLVGNGAK